MMKSLAALAVFAVLGASVIALPGFAPKVQAVRPLHWQRQIGFQSAPLLSTASAGLAGFRHRVFASQRFGSKDCGSSSRDSPSLGETFSE